MISVRFREIHLKYNLLFLHPTTFNKCVIASEFFAQFMGFFEIMERFNIVQVNNIRLFKIFNSFILYVIFCPNT